MWLVLRWVLVARERHRRVGGCRVAHGQEVFGLVAGCRMIRSEGMCWEKIRWEGVCPELVLPGVVFRWLLLRWVGFR